MDMQAQMVHKKAASISAEGVLFLLLPPSTELYLSLVLVLVLAGGSPTPCIYRREGPSLGWDFLVQNTD